MPKRWEARRVGSDTIFQETSSPVLGVSHLSSFSCPQNIFTEQSKFSPSLLISCVTFDLFGGACGPYHLDFHCHEYRR